MIVDKNNPNYIFICTICKTPKENIEYSIKRGARRVRNYSSSCKECDKLRLEKYSKTRVYKNLAKQYQIKYKFKLSIEDWNKMYNNQNGCCAICEIHQDKLNKNLAVDHDHKTGKVRGLLCQTCNTAIGLLKDNIEILNKAIKYLNK